MRPSGRAVNELRAISFSRNYIKHPEGSVLVRYGDTEVLCNVSINQGVPRFIKEQNTARNEKQGWLTAEYGMLPRATQVRTEREAVRGKQGGRTVEIQRLIGRALRNCVNLKELGENTIMIDCDVLQADGGTRTAAITGSCVALYDAIQSWQNRIGIQKKIFLGLIASVSVGVYKEQAVLDLDYLEDSQAETDMNVVMNDELQFIEVQGTAEKASFERILLNDMLDLAHQGIQQIIQKQKSALNLASVYL